MNMLTVIEAQDKVLLTLFMMLAAAKLFAEIFERLRQPAVVGEILAGVIIGPSVLGWVAPTDITTTLAEIGVIFLLFTVGLETKPASIFRVGKRALLVAVLGVVTPFLAGWTDESLGRLRPGVDVSRHSNGRHFRRYYSSCPVGDGKA
jgi:Kef-type K+ transport system membrane component KefB